MKNPAPANIDEYIDNFPPDTQIILHKIRALIQKTAPTATEKISYKMPTYYLNGNLVHFAAYKAHIGFYPSPSGVAAFKDDISRYKWAKGSVQFPLDKPVPYDLIRKITKYRVKEALEKHT